MCLLRKVAATCHRTSGWVPATFNHAGIAAGSCAACHNGTTAKGKSATHLPTSQSCDTCHRTSAWAPATFNHTGVVAGTCATCHDGTKARGKTTTHVSTLLRAAIPVIASSGWLPATYVHPANSSGTCSTCHVTAVVVCRRMPHTFPRHNAIPATETLRLSSPRS